MQFFLFKSSFIIWLFRFDYFLFLSFKEWMSPSVRKFSLVFYVYSTNFALLLCVFICVCMYERACVCMCVFQFKKKNSYIFVLYFDINGLLVQIHFSFYIFCVCCICMRFFLIFKSFFHFCSFWQICRKIRSFIQSFLYVLAFYVFRFGFVVVVGNSFCRFYLVVCVVSFENFIQLTEMLMWATEQVKCLTKYKF